MFTTPKISRIATDTPSVYAFRVAGGVNPDEIDAMARLMEEAFERHGKVSMLILLEDFHASDALAGMSLKSLSTQARSASHIRRYAVVGAPSLAATMIETFDKVSPVEAGAFDKADLDAAWDFVGARPALSPGE